MWNRTEGTAHDVMLYQAWRNGVGLSDEPVDAASYYGIDPAWLDPHSAFYIVPELEITAKESQRLFLEAIHPGAGNLVNMTQEQTKQNGQAMVLDALHPGASALKDKTDEELAKIDEDLKSCSMGDTSKCRPIVRAHRRSPGNSNSSWTT